MILKYVFLVIVILPSGETSVRSSPVDACPNIQLVHEGYESLVESGDIKQWDAQCILFQFQIPKEQT